MSAALDFSVFLKTPEAREFKAQIRHALTDRTEALVEALLGPPKSRRGRRWRFPNAVDVEIHGRKRGAWYSWHEQRGGGLLELIRWARGGDDVEAWRFASSWLGIVPSAVSIDRTQSRRDRLAWSERMRQRRELAERRAAAERSERIGGARHTWAASIPIAEGSIGDRYLVETRGIPRPEGGWPADVMRWHGGADDPDARLCPPGGGMLVFAATTAAGMIAGVHKILLTADAANVIRRDRDTGKSRKLKISRGVFRETGAVVRFPPRRPFRAALQYGEGVETSLSAWRGTDLATHALLRSLAQADPPEGRPAILLRDDDEVGGRLDRAIDATIARIRERAGRVAAVTPWEERRGTKEDFNDLLRQEGVEAVRLRLRSAELELLGLRPAPAPFERPAASLAEARDPIWRGLLDFRREERNSAAPRMLLGGEPGLGKTEALVRYTRMIGTFDKAMRRGSRFVVLVPDHRLGREIAARYEGEGLNVAVFRGRGGPDKRGEALCKDLDAVAAALYIGADVDRTVCGTLNGPQCPHRFTCPYFRQRELAARPDVDVVVAAHNFLVQPLPEEIRRNARTVIIDEDPSGHLDGTVAVALTKFSDLAVLEHPADDAETTAELEVRLPAVYQILHAQARGVPLAEAIAASGRDAEWFTETNKMNWSRKLPHETYPGMPLAERKERAGIAGPINTAVRRMHGVFKALAAAASGETDGVIEVDHEAVTVHRLRDLAAWLETRAIVLASASRQPQLAKVFPNATVVNPPAVGAPHRRVIQYFGASGRVGARRKLRDITTLVELYAASGRPVLVIAVLELMTELREALGHLPNVHLRHHGAIVGSDNFGDVGSVIVIGGLFPKPADVARMATPLAGELVAPAPPVRSSAVALLADGSGVEFPVWRYDNPHAEAVHAGIYGGSIIQAGGRARGLLRTAGNPVTEVHFANWPLPMAVDELAPWPRDWRLERMLLRGYVPLSNTADLARAHPDLFPSRGAAKQWRRRCGGATELLEQARRLAEEHLPGPWLRLTWQPGGQGQKPRAFDLVRRDRIDSVRRWIEREFPGLAAWNAELFCAGARGVVPAEKRGTEPTKDSNSGLYPSFFRPPAASSVAGEPRAPPDG